MKSLRRVLVVCMLALAAGARAEITLVRQPLVTDFRFRNATVITSAPGDTTRLFCAMQQGEIRLVRLDQSPVQHSRFLAMGVASGGETGLLGLAFHPQYESNGAFYLYYHTIIQNQVQAVLARGQRDPLNPDVALPGLQTLWVAPSASIHTGGWIGFGNDGFLYVSIGDNGTIQNAQIISNNLRGKILRLDVDGADGIPGNSDDDGFPADEARNYAIPASNPFVGAQGDDEIWAYGLRNPFRCSFDPVTGDLWIGDVGSSTQEEISIAPAGVGGLNFGWPCWEGLFQRTCSTPNIVHTRPFAAYQRTLPAPAPLLPVAGNYIIGGVVYRGQSMTCLRGRYLFIDGSSELHSLWRNAQGQVRFFQSHTAALGGGFGYYTVGQDAAGELYLANWDGQLARLGSSGTSGPDCNQNGTPDDCDIMQGVSNDGDQDGVPDECECDSIDFNNDGSFFDPTDVDALLSVFSEGPCIPAEASCNDVDFNNDTSLFDPCDIDSFLLVFSEGPCTNCGE